ncbi:hypothetical protein [Actibacterium mucosum]|nr:hypothetical protein [Actibacterium mucosum]
MDGPATKELQYQNAWASARMASRLDTEMAALLRISLLPSFETANSWSELKLALASKGFYLRHAQDLLKLCDSISHIEICTTQFLGVPADELQQRLL